MCGGGGDGGAGEIRRQESERNYKTAQATRAVNEIFGIDDSDLYQFTDYGYGYSLPNATNQLNRAANNADARESLYGTTTTDIINYLRSQFDEYHADANEEAKYSLARRGLTGGQADINLRNKIMETFDRGVLDITNQADSAVAGLRAADEDARMNLLAQIQNGMDSSTAVSSASGMLKNNVDVARSDAMSQQVANIFNEIDELYTTQQYMNGVNQLYYPQQSTGAAIVNPSSYGGSIYR